MKISWVSYSFLERILYLKSKQIHRWQIRILFLVKCRCLFSLRYSLLAQKKKQYKHLREEYRLILSIYKKKDNVRPFFWQSLYILAWT